MRHVTGFGLTLAERVAPGWRACLELPAETGHMLPCRDGLPQRRAAGAGGVRDGDLSRRRSRPQKASPRPLWHPCCRPSRARLVQVGKGSETPAA